jgi:hypothetical protein
MAVMQRVHGKAATSPGRTAKSGIASDMGIILSATMALRDNMAQDFGKR